MLVDGVPVEQYPLESLRRRIGVVPQKAVLFHGTIRENLLWGDPDADDRASVRRSAPRRRRDRTE